VVTTIREHTFFANPVGPGAVVLDLGAHNGEFARGVTERFGARCIAVEASAEMAAKIAATDRIEVRHAAIAGHDGEATLNLAANYEASSIHGGEAARGTESVTAMTLASLLDREGLDQVALAKVDIEGAEIGLFDGTPDEVLLHVAQFTVEFHDSNGLISTSDIDRVSERLRELGFGETRFTRGNHNTLFFQPDRCGVSKTQAAYARYVARPLIAARRRV
jgi:FkbM family methyltransferase